MRRRTFHWSSVARSCRQRAFGLLVLRLTARALRKSFATDSPFATDILLTSTFVSFPIARLNRGPSPWSGKVLLLYIALLLRTSAVPGIATPSATRPQSTSPRPGGCRLARPSHPALSSGGSRMWCPAWANSALPAPWLNGPPVVEVAHALLLACVPPVGGPLSFSHLLVTGSRARRAATGLLTVVDALVRQRPCPRPGTRRVQQMTTAGHTREYPRSRKAPVCRKSLPSRTRARPRVPPRNRSRKAGVMGSNPIVGLRSNW